MDKLTSIYFKIFQGLDDTPEDLNDQHQGVLWREYFYYLCWGGKIPLVDRLIAPKLKIEQYPSQKISSTLFSFLKCDNLGDKNNLFFYYSTNKFCDMVFICRLTYLMCRAQMVKSESDHERNHDNRHSVMEWYMESLKSIKYCHLLPASDWTTDEFIAGMKFGSCALINLSCDAMLLMT